METQWVMLIVSHSPWIKCKVQGKQVFQGSRIGKIEDNLTSDDPLYIKKIKQFKKKKHESTQWTRVYSMIDRTAVISHTLFIEPKFMFNKSKHRLTLFSSSGLLLMSFTGPGLVLHDLNHYNYLIRITPLPKPLEIPSASQFFRKEAGSGQAKTGLKSKIYKKM